VTIALDDSGEDNVQSDWNQATTTADDYIKNKPVAATQTTDGLMSATDKTKLDGIPPIWTGTQAEYNAITTKDSDTIYMIFNS
jgi:hypothetical protein